MKITQPPLLSNDRESGRIGTTCQRRPAAEFQDVGGRHQELGKAGMAGDKRHNLRALQTFEAVARHSSITKAADELGVTQSAVSHQLRKLSDDIGERLVVKSGRQVVLTDAGRRLGIALQAAFLQIDRSVSDAIGSDRKILRLAVCSSFAPGWLIGKLDSFYERNPTIDLQLRMYAKDPDLTDLIADAFVTTLPKEAGFWSMRLESELLVPIYSSRFAPFRPGSLPLITTDLQPERIGEDWKKYCELAGLALDELRSTQWLQVSHYVLGLEMARAGLGIALVPEFLARADLKSGRLTTLNDAAYPTGEDYFLCVKSSRRREPELSALAQWFRAQIALPSAEQPARQ